MSCLMKTKFFCCPVLSRTSLRFYTTPSASSIETSVLPNGIRIATEKRNTKTTSLGVYFNAGSSNENSTNNGTAHLLSRIAFKGTNPSFLQTAEGLGAKLKSTANRKYLSFTAQCLSEDAPKLLDLLAEASQNLNTSQEVVNQVKSDVLKEDNAEVEQFHLISEHLHSVAYQGNSLAFGIRGSPDSRQNITSDVLQEFIKQNFTGNRLVVSVAGAVEHQHIVDQVKSRFGSLPAGEAVNYAKEKNSYVGSMVTLREDDDPNIVVCAGFEGPGLTSPDYYPMLLAQTIIGNWDLSLAGGKVIRTKYAEQIKKDQLADFVQAYHFPYTETGLYGVYAVVKDIEDREHHTSALSHQLVSSIYGAYHRIGYALGEGELQFAKLRLQNILTQLYSRNSYAIDAIADQALSSSKVYSLFQLVHLIEQINSKTVKEVAMHYGNDVEPVVAAKGSMSNWPDYNFIRSWTWQPFI